MDCLISAGGVPQEEDLLYEATRGKSKALLPIAGKPMVQWVLDALSNAACVDRIILIGLKPEDGVNSPKLIAFVPDQGSLLKNILAGTDRLLEVDPTARQVMMCSSDIPLITPSMVDEFAAQCSDQSISFFYGAIPRQVMEERFPESRRSYVHFSDGDVAGADLFIADPRLAKAKQDLWNDLIGSRKNALKQARRIGIGLLIKLLLRRLSIAEAEHRIGKALDLTGKAIIVKNAELGMDVDKPFQLEICRRELGE
ncbi:MAG: nucleotidyltransferase family protein [Anaerolineales bacterium]|nr:nucleotidyltransferase family protein [Anaerolineales bacterium]